MPGRFVPQGAPAVLYGDGAVAEVAAVLGELGAARVLVVTTRSLAAQGRILDTVVSGLGPRWAGTFLECRQHTPDTTVSAGRDAFIACGADALVSVGGGSAVDTAKGIALSAAVGDDLTAYHANVVHGEDGTVRMRRGARHRQLVAVARHARRAPGDGSDADADGPCLVPHVSVPTTLSGAEYTDHAGITTARTGVKHQVYHPGMVPVAVVLDPRATAATPRDLWLSTGVKVLDHVVEIVSSPGTSPASQALCLGALRRVVRHLSRSAEPGALADRAELQIAAWLAVAGYPNQMAGVSHAIDHQLGACCDVPHGIGACCVLPHAMRFNRSAADEAFRLMAGEIGGADDRPGACSPAERVIGAVERIVAELGLPSRLRDVGVTQEVLPRLARQALADPAIAGNPRPVASAEEILDEILVPAW